MDLATIEISPEQAEASLKAIEDLVATDRTAEDLALAQAYRATKRGLPIISMSRAFELAGVFDNGLPKLGLVQADAKACRIQVDRYSAGEGKVRYNFSDAAYQPTSRARIKGVNHVNIDVAEPGVKTSWRSAEALVPLIPAQHRPRPNRLRKFYILWEVEAWDRTAPYDPALVRHLRGDLWTVLATWDLTELERLVLTQRA